MTPSPTPSLDGEAGEASSVFDELIAFDETSEVKPTWADAVRIALAAKKRAAIPALPPDTGKQAVQFQRRRGIGDGSGGFKWCEWQVCTEQDARRIASLRSWQWRKIVMPVASQPAPTPDAARPTKERYAELIEQTLDDDFAIGHQRAPTHLHIKSGGKYRELARGFLQSAVPLEDMCELVAYVGEDGRTWFRPPSEFDDDERFARLAASMQDTSSPQSPEHPSRRKRDR